MVTPTQKRRNDGALAGPSSPRVERNVRRYSGSSSNMRNSSASASPRNTSASPPQYILSQRAVGNPYLHAVRRPTTRVENRQYTHVRVGKPRAPAFRMPSSSVAYVLDLFGREADIEMMGQGSYGDVYLVNDARAATRGIDELRRRLSSKVAGTAPAQGKGVVVKVSVPRPNMPWRAFLQMCLHEAKVHAHLSRKDTCARVACSGVKVCASQFTPKLHLAGADAERGVFVSVMSLARGMPLGMYMKQHPLTAEAYVQVEKSVASMWLLGIVHGDLHHNNVFLSRTKSGAFSSWLIDFGMAVVLPADKRAAVQKVINNNPAMTGSLANAAWYAKNMIGEYANQIMGQRDFPLYNADGKMLRVLWNKVPAADRARIPQLRSQAWKCGAQAPDRRKLTRQTAMRPKRQHLRQR